MCIFDMYELPTPEHELDVLRVLGQGVIEVRDVSIRIVDVAVDD